MMRLPISCLLILLTIAAAPCRGQLATQPTALPDSYRDLLIFTTSAPADDDAGRIVMSMQLTHRGDRPLETRIALDANADLGFAGDAFSATLKPGATQSWRPSFRPPDGLQREIITGRVYFGGIRDRDLYIVVCGPDPDGWKPHREPDVDDPADTLAITDRAQVVATHAPRVRIDWWRSHRSSSIDPLQRVAPLLTLAEKGATDYAIVLEVDDTARSNDHFKQAVDDLVRCLRVISGGAELAVTEERKGNGPAIILTLQPDDDLSHPDAYHLQTQTNGNVIIRASHVDGLRNGVYGLLTDHLDCHWFMPGGVGEEIPRPADQKATIGQINQQRTPSFYSARGSTWYGGPWNYRNRNIIRDGVLSFGHAWAALLKGTPELYEKHPEWWARDREGNIRLFDKEGGWSFTNFCTTNPEVLDIVSKKVDAELSRPGAVIASLDPNDYAPFCLCETCTALDKHYGAENPDGSFSTDRMIHFANEVHSRLSPESQKKMLGFLVYAFQIELPTSARPHPNVIGMICNMDWSYDHTRPMNDPTSPSSRKFLRLMKGWGEILTQFGFYDYPTDYVHYAPYGQVMKIREDWPLVHELGVTFMCIEGQSILATSALNLYISSRLQYDITEDVDVLVEEFIEKLHGPAAEPMRKYWLGAEYYTGTLRPGPRAQDRMTRLPEMWRDLDGYLSEAEAIVAKLPESEQRFKDRIAYHRRGFELGRRKCAIRDAAYRIDGKLRDDIDAASVLRDIEDFRAWIIATRQLHGESEGYFPPLIPGYYYGELLEFLTKTEQDLKRAVNDR